MVNLGYADDAQLKKAINAAWLHLNQDNPSLAMQFAKEAHEISSDSPDVCHLLGLLACRDGKPEIGLPLLQKALDIGGKTSRRLKDISEALLISGHAQAALMPLNDAIMLFGETEDLLGLKSAIEISMEKWGEAAKSAKRAVSLNPALMAWELNVSFSELMQLNLVDGFKYATARTENRIVGSACPLVNQTEPCEVWLKGEQGIGDTLFYLRYVPSLLEKGWRFHLEVDKKIVPLLGATGLFLTVKEKNIAPTNAISFNVGDIALMAQQCDVVNIPPPLPLVPNAQQVEKLKKELADFGPAPYIAVTWRGGPKGRKQKSGVRMLEKAINPSLLGRALRNSTTTIVNIQRLPILEEVIAFHEALGRKALDFTALNNNLGGMLALLSVVDEYITVSNTNLHLREGLSKSSHVFVNRPFQDWRWLYSSSETPWYPNSVIYRQAHQGKWDDALTSFKVALHEQFPVNQNQSSVNESLNLLEIKQSAWAEMIAEGWQAIELSNVPLAIGKAQAVLSQSTDHARALHLLGWAAVTDFKFDIATQVLKKATDLAPNDGIIWRDYIRSLTLSEDFELAISSASDCLNNRNIRSKSAIYYALAATHFKIGNELDALENYEKCLSLAPNNLDASAYSGMIRMKLDASQVGLGFKLYSSRKESRRSEMQDVWVCPVLKGNIQGLKILIVRDMGLGDELTYLRYLPWLINAGAKVTYWCGKKLKPLLDRLEYPITIVADDQDRPNVDDFDVSFIVTDLPYAVSDFGAPEIAPPLTLKLNTELVAKWQQSLKQYGQGPFIGFNWRAGVAGNQTTMTFSKLSKEIDAELFAKSLSNVSATWISLQRNVTKQELIAFEKNLNAKVIDLAGQTDDLDDLLALLYCLDANVGVSNTNMHLRAGLGLGSDVLVQSPGGDWRWGVSGNQSLWFENCNVYRQGKLQGWDSALNTLNLSLTQRFGVRRENELMTESNLKHDDKKRKIIWVTAGVITHQNSNLFSTLESAQSRIIAPSKRINNLIWHSLYLNEKDSEVMGAWNGKVPKAGDIVVISKVISNHVHALIKDAQDRGAYVVVDVFNNFSDQPSRFAHQSKMLAVADAVISTNKLRQYWEKVNIQIDAFIEDIKPESTESDAENIANQWQALFNQVVSKQVKLTKTVSFSVPKKRVLVGVMFSGENEYEETINALKNQAHQNFELFEVKNLANKLAHDTLYDKFMESSDDFDYFLKLDADMVFAHNNVLGEMIEAVVAEDSALLFAYVKDCPSGLMIPGIQMFKSDTKWLGSDEQLNVDYAPALKGSSKTLMNKSWINHMPNPSAYQLFRYGIHKALKSLQPDRTEKNMKKGILHLSILNGVSRNVLNDEKQSSNLIYTLIGATLVYQKAFDSIDYNNEQAKKYFDILQKNENKFEVMKKMAIDFWSNEIQVNYWWLDNVTTFEF